MRRRRVFGRAYIEQTRAEKGRSHPRQRETPSALFALIKLGFKERVVMRVLENLSQDRKNGEPPIETIVKEALARTGDAIADLRTGVGDEPLEAATLLVSLAGASDEVSRRAATKRVRQYLETRRDAVAEDDRAFVKALARMTSAKASPTFELSSRVLDGRPRLARVLEVLRKSPKSVSSLELFREAWPDEAGVDRATADARVRKAISLLRGLGLRGAVVRTDGGYALR